MIALFWNDFAPDPDQSISSAVVQKFELLK